MVLEPGDDPGHLMANVFQEEGNDENPEAHRPMAAETTCAEASGISFDERLPRSER